MVKPVVCGYVCAMGVFAALPALAFHSADTSGGWSISLTELLRVVQLYNAGPLHCDEQAPDGVGVGVGGHICPRHESDYLAPAWEITLSELLRAVQLFNATQYHCCGKSVGEDGYCPGAGVDACNAPVQFADAALEAAVRDAIGKPAGDLTPADLSDPAFTELRAPLAGISDLSGIEHCTSLERLDLHGNCLANISPLASLYNLVQLNLHDNDIADITALQYLERLDLLWLSRNNIEELAALSANQGLNGIDEEQHWDRINLNMNPLGLDDAVILDSIETRGAFVWRPVLEDNAKQTQGPQRTARLELVWRGGVVRLVDLVEYEGPAPAPRAPADDEPRVRVVDARGNKVVAALRFGIESTSCGPEAPGGGSVGDYAVADVATMSLVLPVQGVVTSVAYADHKDAQEQALYSLEEKGIDPCSAADEAGDAIPIGARLVHGDPALPDELAYVLLIMGDAFPLEELGNPRTPLAASSTHYIPYSQAVADSFNFFLQQEPFDEFQSLLKIYRVDFISTDNRPTDLRDEPPTLRDTALRMERKAVGFNYDQGYIARLAGNTGIAWDKIVLIPNGDGSGTQSADFIVYSNFSPSRKMTALHEFGHGIGELADEYEYRHGTNPPESYPPDNVDEPNAIARGMAVPALEDIPWRHWLQPGDAACIPANLGEMVDFNCLPGEGSDCQCGPLPMLEAGCIPLPTCEPDGDYVAQDGKLYGRSAWPAPGNWPSVVGLFEGGKYRRKGCYRPELRCRMRSDDDVEPGLPETPLFCRVCRENLVMQMVSRAGNVAAATPEPGEQIVLGEGQSLSLSVTLHSFEDEAHRPVVVKWEIDGATVPGETEDELILQANSLSAGNHTVRVTTRNPTPWVHPDWEAGQQAMEQVVEWVVVKI